MELLDNNEFTAHLCYMRILTLRLFSLSILVWENTITVEGVDFMGHIRLVVQGHGVDLSRASWILA